MMSFREFVKVCLIQKYATMSGRESYVEYRWLQLCDYSNYMYIFADL